MPGSKAVKERIERLIAEASGLSSGNDSHGQMAWLISAQSCVQLVCPSQSNPYHTHAERVVSERMARPSFKVSQMAALLSRLLEEIEHGVLTAIENHAIAVTFDDFLDHGAEYLKHGRKNEAGVIVGIVFADTIRRACRILGVAENGVALDALISELTKRDVLTPLKAKRARAAAGLRTSAARARWDEFELSDVGPVIEFTRELLSAHLE